MEVNEANKATLLKLARLTDKEITEYSQDVGQAAFEALVRKGVTIGANGDPSALHLRVGRASNGRFRQTGQRTLATGAEFAANTGSDGKAGTAAQFGMNSFEATQMYGDEVGPKGPRRWRGGAFVPVTVDFTDTDVEDIDGSVSSASGVQGDFDLVASVTTAQTQASLISQRLKAQRALTEAGVSWNDTPAPPVGITVHE